MCVNCSALATWVRLALGAGRSRIVKHLTAEGLRVSFMGAAAGLHAE
jgi:hypothetical protein